MDCSFCLLLGMLEATLDGFGLIVRVKTIFFICKTDFLGKVFRGTSFFGCGFPAGDNGVFFGEVFR